MPPEELGLALGVRADMLQHPSDGAPARLHAGLRHGARPGQGQGPRGAPAAPAAAGQEGRPAGAWRPAGGGRAGPAVAKRRGRPGPGHHLCGPGAGEVGLAEGAQDVRLGAGRRAVRPALRRVQGHPRHANQPGASPLAGAGRAPLDGALVGGSVRGGGRVGSGAGLRPLPSALLRTRPRASGLPRRLPRRPPARVVTRPADGDPGLGGAPGLLPAGAQPQGADAAAQPGVHPMAHAPRLPAEPHAQPGEEGLPDRVRVPGGRGRGAQHGAGAGAQRLPAEGQVHRPQRGAGRPQGAAPHAAQDARRGPPAAAPAPVRLRHPHVRAGRARPLPSQQERPGAAGRQGAGAAFPPQGIHLQPVRDQLHPLAERGRRGQRGRARRVQRDQLRVPVRAVLRGEGHDAAPRREVHGLRVHQEHAGVRDVRGRGAVPGPVAHVLGALGPAEQAGAPGLEGAAEQREPAPLRRVQAGGGRAVPKGSFEHGPAQPHSRKGLGPWAWVSDFVGTFFRTTTPIDVIMVLASSFAGAGTRKCVYRDYCGLL